MAATGHACGACPLAARNQARLPAHPHHQRHDAWDPSQVGRGRRVAPVLRRALSLHAQVGAATKTCLQMRADQSQATGEGGGCRGGGRPFAKHALHSSVDACSKLCNILFTYELARQLQKEGSNVTVVAYDPVGAVVSRRMSRAEARWQVALQLSPNAAAFARPLACSPPPLLHFPSAGLLSRHGAGAGDAGAGAVAVWTGGAPHHASDRLTPAAQVRRPFVPPGLQRVCVHPFGIVLHTDPEPTIRPSDADDPALGCLP